jgi:hypothetical protein
MLKYFFSLLTVFICINTYSQEEKFISISVYNFTRYINWPANNSGGNFVIDIIGHKSVYDKLKELTAGRKTGTREIVVRYLESVNAITTSDILFIGFWQSKDMSKVLDKIGNNNTLIIGEKDGLIDAGAGINFVIRNDVIKFEIKAANIQKYGLKISEELLKLAYKSY